MKSPGSPEPDATRNYYFPIPEGKLVYSDKEVPIYREFEANPLEPNYQSLQHFFVAQYKDISKADFCHSRIVVHTIIDRLLREGWQELRYPEAALRADLEAARMEDLTPYMKNGKLDVYPRVSGAPAKGTLILRHFMTCGDVKYKNRPTLRESWTPNILCRVINRCIAIKEDITRSTIVRQLTIYPSNEVASGPTMPPINIWRVVFNLLKPQGVYDLDPHFGEKAIAAHINGISYTPITSPISEWLGSKPGIPDFTILNNMSPIETNDLNDRISRSQTDKMIAIITKAQAANLNIIHRWDIKTDPKVLGLDDNILAVVQKYK